MKPQKWDFQAVIEELQKGDSRRKRRPTKLRVSPDKIQAELHLVVECYFANKENHSLPPIKVKEKYAALIADLGQARAKLTAILQSTKALTVLIASDEGYQGKSYSRQRLLGTFDHLCERIRTAEREAKNRVRGGRLKSGHRQFLFLNLCGLYEKYTGTLPGRTGADGEGCVDGPFVRFVVAVFREIEPEEARTAKLKSAISRAITDWKTAKGRKGKKYDYGFNR